MLRSVARREECGRVKTKSGRMSVEFIVFALQSRLRIYDQFYMIHVTVEPGAFALQSDAQDETQSLFVVRSLQLKILL